MKKKVKLESCSQPVLVHAVKAVNKLGLKCPQGTWKEYVQGLSGPSSKVFDPARHQQQDLQAFLASLQASGDIKKPKKLLEALLAYYGSLLEEAEQLPRHHPLYPPKMAPKVKDQKPGSSSKLRSSRPSSKGNEAGPAVAGSKRQRSELGSQAEGAGGGPKVAAAAAVANGAAVADGQAKKKPKHEKSGPADQPAAATAAIAAAAAVTPAAGAVSEKQAKKQAKQSKGGPADQPAAAAPNQAAADGQATSAAAAGGGGAAAAAAKGGGAEAQGGSIHPAWRLVQRTQQHPDFLRLYDFPSWEKGWKRTSRLPAPDLSVAPELLGLDCEMCATTAGDKVLLSAALVDQAGRILVRQLVQPEGDILDLRSDITGITKEQLSCVDLDRAQLLARFLLPRLGPQVVLVGHALHNDLRALQLDHLPVIDTSLLFSYKGLASAKPSLVHLAQLLLGKQLRGADGQSVHDVYEDATATLALVERELEQQQPTGLLEPPAVKVDKAVLSQLLVHKIPADTSWEQLQASLVTAAGPGAPAFQVEGYAATQQLGSKVVLVFSHPGDVEKFFQSLPGGVTTDSVGRRTKPMRVGKRTALVRRMAAHGGLSFGKDLAKDRGAPKRSRHPKSKHTKKKQKVAGKA